MVVVSAPGKCIIIGEHAIVYGEPGIIAAVGLRTKVTAEKSPTVRYVDSRWNHDDTWQLEDVKTTTRHVLDLWQACSEKKDFSPLFADIKANRYENYKKAVIGIVLDRLHITGGMSIEIKSEIPGGSGLGSSSSLAVCLVKAAALLYGKNIDDNALNDIAYELEKIIHGTPSGGDNSACCFGSLIWFQRGQPRNIIIPLQKEIPGKLENFILVNTGTPEKTTGELIQIIRNHPDEYKIPRIRQLGALTKDMRSALKEKNTKRMKDVLNEAQTILAELGVSSPEIDAIARAVRTMGGGAKLCGAGGGGIMLCWHEDGELLAKTIHAAGYEPLTVELAVEGVREVR